METFDEATGDKYRFRVNCTNPALQYFWSRIAWIIPGEDEDRVKWMYDHFVDREVTIGVEIDGKAITTEDTNWDAKWTGSGWSGPGNPEGDFAVLKFEGTDTFLVIDYIYRLDAKELAFTLSAKEHDIRLVFDVTGYRKALDPLLEHCGLD